MRRQRRGEGGQHALRGDTLGARAGASPGGDLEGERVGSSRGHLGAGVVRGWTGEGGREGGRGGVVRGESRGGLAWTEQGPEALVVDEIGLPDQKDYWNRCGKCFWHHNQFF